VVMEGALELFSFFMLNHRIKSLLTFFLCFVGTLELGIEGVVDLVTTLPRLGLLVLLLPLEDITQGFCLNSITHSPLE